MTNVVPFRRPASKQLETDNPPKRVIVAECEACGCQSFSISTDREVVCAQCCASYHLDELLAQL